MNFFICALLAPLESLHSLPSRYAVVELLEGSRLARTEHSARRGTWAHSLGEVIDVYLYLLQYKKPPQVIEMEQRVMEELKSVATIKDDQCKPS